MIVDTTVVSPVHDSVDRLVDRRHDTLPLADVTLSDTVRHCANKKDPRSHRSGSNSEGLQGSPPVAPAPRVRLPVATGLDTGSAVELVLAAESLPVPDTNSTLSPSFANSISLCARTRTGVQTFAIVQMARSTSCS